LVFPESTDPTTCFIFGRREGLFPTIPKPVATAVLIERIPSAHRANSQAMAPTIRAATIHLLLVLLAFSSAPGVVSLSATTNNKHVDRRTAIHRAGAAAASLGTITAGGLVIPNAPVAQAAVDTVNPIATLSDGSKFPLASFGLQ
jgi:hypothetical protein